MSILFKNQLQIECGEAYTVDSFEPATSFYRRNPPKEKEASRCNENGIVHISAQLALSSWV